MKVQQSEEAEKQIRYVLLIVKRKIYQSDPHFSCISRNFQICANSVTCKDIWHLISLQGITVESKLGYKNLRNDKKLEELLIVCLILLVSAIGNVQRMLCMENIHACDRVLILKDCILVLLHFTLQVISSTRDNSLFSLIFRILSNKCEFITGNIDNI